MIDDVWLEDLRHRGEAPECLDMDFSDVTDAGMVYLKGWDGLQTLNLEATRITDVGLVSLGELSNLETLILRDTQVGDPGLKHLTGLKRMVTLDLAGTPTTSSGLSFLRQMRAVTDLHLARTQVDDSGLRHLVGMSRLTSLSLSETKITDESLKSFARFEGLEKLWLSETEITDRGLSYLAGLRNLKWLYLEGTRVTDAGLAHLSGLTALEELGLRGTEVTDRGLVYLTSLCSLEGLVLPDKPITDAGLAVLHDVGSLKWIYTGYVMATDGRRTPPIRIVALDQTGDASPSQWEGLDDQGEEVYIRFRYGLLSVNNGLFQRHHGGKLEGTLSYEELVELTRGFLIFDQVMVCPHCNTKSEFEYWVDDEFCWLCGRSRNRTYSEPLEALAARETKESTETSWEIRNSKGEILDVRYRNSFLEVRDHVGDQAVTVFKRTLEDRPNLSEIQTELGEVVDLWALIECPECRSPMHSQYDKRCPQCGRTG